MPLSSGSQDISFADGGFAYTQIETLGSTGSAMVIQSDGSVVAAGSAEVSSGIDNFVLVRYEPDSPGEGNITYDYNGNTSVDMNGNTFTYDAWNRMVTETPPGSTYHETYYTYNALGERVSELDGIQSGVGPVLIINDGNAQRSMIDNLTVVFQEPVSLSVLTGSGAFTTTGAFTLENTSGTFVSVNYSNPSGDDKTWLISFTNSMSFSLDSDGSLPNGGYTLSVVQSDTSGAGAPGSNVNYTFARLYGDFFGTLTANFGDLVYVLQHYDQTVQPGMWFTDQNQDGVIGFDELVGVLDDYDHLEGANNSGAIFKGASQTQDVGGVGNITAGLSPQEFYYSASWQILQQNECNPTTGLMQTANQFVWGLAYVNELVLRDSDSDGSSSSGSLGVSGSGLDLRLYAAQDANYNVVALINISGTVVQRFDTTPYGTVTVLSASGVQTLDSYGWQIGFQGGWVDKMNGLIFYQDRIYNPATDTWLTQEPFGAAYIDGMNLYQAFEDNPISFVDPLGLAAAPIDPSTVPFMQRGPILPNGQPQGLPSIPGGWKLGPQSNPKDLTSPYRWNPADRNLNRGPNGAQPNGSWDFKDGYWRYNPSDGSKTQHFWPDGTPVAPEDFNNGKGYQPEPNKPTCPEDGPTAPRPYSEPQPPGAPGFWLKLWNAIEDIGDHVKEPFIIIIDPDEFMREEQRELNSGNIV